MKNTELRIGNIVECFGIREVVAIKKDKIKVQNETEKGHFILEWTPITSLSLKPIKLNEEHLLKFGFKDVSSSLEKIFEKQNFKWHSSTDEIVVELDNGMNGFDLWTNCKHVHELQNLFFSITGTELSYEY